MRLPNKLFSYEESTLANLPVVLTELEDGPLPVLELLERVRPTIGDAAEFLDTMICLYALGAVELTDERQVISHAGTAMV